jgi:hydrophobic/amphiphilic exporter-1 (mainly G- bacteria), HAE1 family
LVPLGFIGSEFLTQADRGEFSVMLELAPGAKIEQTNLVTGQVEEILAKIPEIQKVFVNVGASSTGMVGQSSSNIAELHVVLAPKTDRQRSTDEISQSIKAKLALIPGITAHVTPIDIWGTSGRTAIQVSVSGSNWDDVYQTAKRVRAIVLQIHGTDDVKLSAEEGKPETRLEIDREKMAALGLTIADVGSTLQVGLTGDDSSKFRDRDGTEYATRIMLDPYDRSKTSEVGNLTVMNHLGQPVEIKQFAKVFQTVGPTKLQRINRNYGIYVNSAAVGRPSGSIGADIKTALQKETFPPGIKFSFDGDLKQQSDSFGSLGIVLIAALVFVFLVMVALYDSFIYPFVVLFSVPLAIIGALLALGLTMNSLNIMSILGIIMQIGLVSKNAILLVDFTNKARAEGFKTKEALIQAGRERLRPILMTTLTMILGMLPIALSTAPGAEFKHGLGWALIGGLTCSMVMTLIVVPVVYLKIDQLRQLLLGVKNGISGKTM